MHKDAEENRDAVRKAESRLSTTQLWATVLGAILAALIGGLQFFGPMEKELTRQGVAIEDLKKLENPVRTLEDGVHADRARLEIESSKTRSEIESLKTKLEEVNRRLDDVNDGLKRLEAPKRSGR